MVIAACVFAACIFGFLLFKKAAKLREMTTKAEFYAQLSQIWGFVARGGWEYKSPPFEEGFAYIHSVSNKRRQQYVREEVYRLLDTSYHAYLRLMHKEMERLLLKEDDESLFYFFELNYRWLFPYEGERWYGASFFDPSYKDGSPDKTRIALTDERDMCSDRIEKKREALLEAARRREREMLDEKLREQRRKGFWRCMADVGLS